MSGGVPAMLRKAIDAKRAADGYFSLREMARACECDHTMISFTLKGERHPSPQMLASWAGYLSPYFPLDEALLAADHGPSDRALADLFIRIARGVRETGGDLIVEIDRVLEHAGGGPGRQKVQRQQRRKQSPGAEPAR